MTAYIMIFVAALAVLALFLTSRARHLNSKLRSVICVSVCVLLVIAEIALIIFYILKQPSKTTHFQDLGVPYAELYSDEQANSRIAEDMVFYEGKLYVGGGDYDANTGPIYVMSYDLKTHTWEASDEPLPDEQIKRFRIIDGALYSPGTDPTGDEDTGNYYVLEDGEWQTECTLPGGVHCFDIAKCNGDLFFALGVNSGNYPAVRFDGEYYYTIPFYKDGLPLDTSNFEIVRVYNFAELNDKLYSFLTFDEKDGDGNVTGYLMELYVYENGTFNYVCGTLPYEDMADTITLGDTLYLILNETLFKTNDLKEFSAVVPENETKMCDIINYNGKVYVLGYSRLSETRYETMIFENTDDGLKVTYSFFTQIPPNSFCRNENTFFVSLGRYGDPATDDTGRIYSIKIK